MNRCADRVRRYSAVGFKMSLVLLATAGLIALPVSAVTYGWGGTSSTDWSTSANWQGGSIAPTGSSYDVTMVVTNKTNNQLVYTAANGSTLYAPTSGRALRIADGANGSMAITGGLLETRGTGDFVGNSSGVSGFLLIDGGIYVSTNNTFLLGANTAAGTLTVNSGSARLATLRLWTSTGTVNLNGGTLALNTMEWQTGAATFNLNGGTLQAGRNTSAWMLSSANWICRLNGSVVFDSIDYCVTNTASLNGTGTVTKVGSGLLALNVSNTLTSVTLNEGTLTLGGSNTLSAGVTLNAGTLNINHAAALGLSAFTLNGGRIDNTSGSNIFNSQNGPINITSNFTFLGTRDLNLGTGTVTLCSNTVVTNAAKTLTFGGSVGDDGGNYGLTVAGSGMLALTGDVAIGGRVTVSGGGSLTLAGANTYTGATTVSAGLLVVANDNALGTTNNATDVGGSSALQMTNAVVENETLYLAGGGLDNRGALQAANNSTGTWNGTIILNDKSASTWTPRLGYKPAGVLIIGGPIKPGLGGQGIHLWISGEPSSGKVLISSTNNTYSGTTGIIRGTLAIGADNALPTVTALDMHPAGPADYSHFDLNGFSQTIGALFDSFATGPRVVTNSSETASLLTVNQSTATSYSGIIAGNLGLVKEGAGSLTLSGTNTYTGETSLKNGTLALGCDGALSPATALTISGGTLVPGPWRNTLQQLTVTGAGTIEIGDGSGRLEFADSSSTTWTGTLELTGTLEPNTIRFGTSATGLTPAQIDMIRVGGRRLWLELSADGYLRRITGTIFLLL